MQDPINNNEELEECMEYWKKELGLEVWRIQSRLVHKHELERDRDVTISYSAEKQWAFLQVLAPTEREPTPFTEDCVAVAVIQGLLELHFQALQFCSKGVIIELQRALNVIARSLWSQHLLASDATEELEKMKTFFIEGPIELENMGIET